MVDSRCNARSNWDEGPLEASALIVRVVMSFASAARGEPFTIAGQKIPEVTLKPNRARSSSGKSYLMQRQPRWPARDGRLNRSAHRAGL